MKLHEMFSPMGGPNETAEQEIDWIGDLKFFIDNEDKLLKTEMFPAIKKHIQDVNNPESFKLYLRPVQKCLRAYRAKFDIQDIDKKFPKKDLIRLSKHIAKEQKQHIQNGDYDAHK